MRDSSAHPPSLNPAHPQPAQSATHDRLSLALESSRQVAFDWHIPDDRLYFSGKPSNELKRILRDITTSRTSRALPSIIHDDDREGFRASLRDVLKGKHHGDDAFHNIELRLKNLDHDWRWVAISGKIVDRDAHGRAVRMVGTFSDIDGRKRAERKIARLRDIYVVLSQVNQAIVRINDRDELFAEICRIAVEQGRFQTAWIDINGHDGMRMASVAAHGMHATVISGTAVRLNNAMLGKHDPVASSMSNQQAWICNDTLSLPTSTGDNDLLQAGIRSIACFPFALSGRHFGALNLYSTEENCFDAQLVDLLKEMVDNISFAIDNRERESERKAIEAALADSEKFKSAILTAAPDCIISINHEGEIISFNDAAELTFGYRCDDVLGKKLADLILPSDWQELHRLGIERFLATGESSVLNKRMELTAIRADRFTFPVELAVVPLCAQEHPIFTAFIRDISERKHAETLQLGQNRILNMVATGVALPEILTEIARFFEKQSGRGLCLLQQLNDEGNALCNRIAPSLPPACMSQPEDLEVGDCHGSSGTAAFRAQAVTVTCIASHPLWAARREHALQFDLKACTAWPVFGRNKKVLGTFAVYFREAVAPSLVEQQLIEVCANLSGIAIESRASEERMRYLAHYDGLTSLPNRFLFKEYLEIALGNARRHGKKFAVFFLDLDKFKEINDTLGHDAGDMVLREIAKRLRASLRHTDKIARMGGDEFYVLIEDLNDGRYAADVAQKLLEEASRPVRIGDRECALSASIGISVYPDDGSDGQSLLKSADHAMYQAKEKGKNGYQFHSFAEGQAENRITMTGHHLRARHPDLDAMRLS
ncbi:MAG TPA: diguanylate cyclase [Noviherbaspirillum sp.]|uniref:diguanylate cyclase domain-containing protein n=1 Tax=Noviherbaspirillum sp. TaxID=1926288 RepID=UPI002B45CD57|nr:diguanylate cyclase [Noviherbaspirillum sp.]HJV85687.1 diguanylate cyclase [Noviherbaspirillum sp.]